MTYFSTKKKHNTLLHSYVYLPLATGETTRILAKAAPVPCPISVTRFGSPLKAGKFSRSQCRPATRSISPKLPCALPLLPVFKKPGTKNDKENKLMRQKKVFVCLTKIQ
jgi:hypothetical protein